jgi:hypothetical protein
MSVIDSGVATQLHASLGQSTTKSKYSDINLLELLSLNAVSQVVPKTASNTFPDLFSRDSYAHGIISFRNLA